MPTARETARTDTTDRILAAARRQLADVGPAALSLRAVAREIDMVSSAVNRYVASRDDLLTALIVQCYDELGEALERTVSGGAPLTRWRTACRAIREWAAQHPHEYALLYGSPVPGYRAPQVTIGPAARPTLVLVRIVVDAHRSDRSTSQHRGDIYSPARDFVVEQYRQSTGDDVAEVLDDALVARTLSAWTAVFGIVSFERFGHLVGVTTDTTAFFEDVVTQHAELLGLTSDQ